MKINGKTVELQTAICLFEFLEQNGFDVSKIAVEQNGKIVSKVSYKDTMLSNNDSIEVVSFVGGG